MKQYKTHLLTFIGLILAIYLCIPPLMSGKKQMSSDVLSWNAMAKESMDYSKKGDVTYWSMRMFSGMPNYTFASDLKLPFFAGKSHHLFLYNNSFAGFFGLIVFSYIGLLLFGISPLIAGFGALFIGFNTWSVDSILAGHSTKMYNVGLMATALGLLHRAYTKPISWWVIGLFFFVLVEMIAVNHIQILYYTMLSGGIISLYYGYEAFKNNSIKSYLVISILLLLISILSIGATSSHTFTIKDYSTETMRGGKSEITATNQSSTSKEGGLNIKYAFSWSYTLDELFNFFIPDAKGGSSNYAIAASDSKLAQQSNSTEDQITLPLYWGEQPFTGAPNYVGIITFVLFMLYLVFEPSKIKWLYLGLVLFSMSLGLGDRIPTNELLFEYLPMYNKFRTPTMAFSIANFFIVLSSVSFLNRLQKGAIEFEWAQIKKSAFIWGGILIVGFIWINSSGYSSVNDSKLLEQYPNFPLSLLREDRQSLFYSDFFKAIFLSLLAFGGVILYRSKSISGKTLILALMIIGLIDLQMVWHRYHDLEGFVDTTEEDQLEAMTAQPYDAILMQDTSYFRIFNTTVNVFNESFDAYKYNCVGGYSPAKLYRYQDLIDKHLSKMNLNVLNMLNTKYFIVGNESGKTAQINPEANGPAWFVEKIQVVNSADEEINALDSFNTKNVAILDKRALSKPLSQTNFSKETASISLKSAHPNKMVYAANNAQDGFAVFSEVSYHDNIDWKATIDGQPAHIYRTNYLLRGLYIPKGAHEIVFELKPAILDKLLLVNTISSILAVIIIGIIYWINRKKNTLETLAS
ncbi:MAG: hypothetical protein MUE53_08445 [Chitinophagales bacterium]|nr:hypothetical protein [Chitinophagales bacterium]